MEASSSPTASRAASALASANQPALVTGGAYTSESTTGVTGRLATATATARASGVKLAGGAVGFDSVVSTATVVSDGQTAKTNGESAVTGLIVGGQAAVIDSSGVHAPGNGGGAAAATQAIQSALKQTGIRLQLAQPVDLIEGPKGNRSVGGLIVSFDATALAKYVDSLPGSLGATLRKQVPFDESLVISFGSVDVEAAGTLASDSLGSAAPTSTDAGSAGGPAVSGLGAVGGDGLGLPGIAGSGTPGAAVGSATAGGRAPLATTPAGAVSEGFGGVTGAVVLALIGALLIAPLLAAVPRRLFAAPASSTTCPEES
jgi:hypothetical protein